MSAALGCVLALAGPTEARAQEPVCEPRACTTVRGVVRRAGDRVRLAETEVVIAAPGDDPDWMAQVTTTGDGRFEVSVPRGRFRVVVVRAGFERFDRTFDDDARGREVGVYLRRDEATAYRTVVEEDRRTAPDRAVATRELDREEIATLPGTQGDALRALQSLPGVARTPGGLGLLVLRGAAPAQSSTFVGEHRVPRAFHALAISSVVPSEAMSGVEYIPGNYESRYGNGTGGVVILHPRPGRRDGVHGHAELDLAGVGSLVEGPVGRGSILAAAQRSHIDVPLRLVERVASQPFTIPSFWDYQLFLDHPTRAGGTVGARVLGAEDQIVSRVQQADGIRDGATFDTGFHRADLEFRKEHGRWSFLLTPSFRYEHSGLQQAFDTASVAREDYVTSLRAESQVRLSRRTRLTLGGDTELDRYRGRASSGDFRGDVTSTGLYGTARIDWGRLVIIPGVRLNAFTHGTDAKIAVDPRLLAHVSLGEKWTWSAGLGSYSQWETPSPSLDAPFVLSTIGTNGRWIYPPSVRQLSPSVLGAPRPDEVLVARAWQASSMLAYRPTAAWSFELGGFARHRSVSLGNRTIDDGVQSGYFPHQNRNYGLELLLRRHNVGRLHGWIAYTLSWARLDQFDPYRRTLVDAFDQRHNLAVVTSYELPRRWRIGGRFRLVSGSPYTPYLGAVDTPLPNPLETWPATAQPIVGEPNSANFPMFHQLDLRVDKTWLLSRASVTGYVDVQNVYNRANVETYLYSPNLRRHEASFGLPIFPSLGLRVDF